MPHFYYQFSHQYIPDLTTSQQAIDYFQKVHTLLLSWQTGQATFTLHSSGSTGTPKPIELTRKQMVASAQATAKALNLPPTTRVLVALNVELIAGFMMLVRTLENQWSATVVVPSSDPLADVPDDFIFDFVALTPMQLQTMLQKHGQARIEQRCKTILLGGAPIDPLLAAQLASYQNKIYHSYGMTETVSHVALRRVNGADASDYYHLLDSIQAGVDTRGCLYLQGAVTQEERVQTNDLVEFSGERHFKWVGRADNIINSGGIKIQLDKIDRAVGTVFSQFSLAIPYFSWYLPDERLGQKLILVVEQSTATLPLTDLKEQLAKHLSKFEIPKLLLAVEKFKKTPSGKIDKRTTVQSADNLSTHLINLR